MLTLKRGLNQFSVSILDMTVNEVGWDDNENSGMGSGSLKLDLHGNISSKPVLVFNKIVLAVPKLVPLYGTSLPFSCKKYKKWMCMVVV